MTKIGSDWIARNWFRVMVGRNSDNQKRKYLHQFIYDLDRRKIESFISPNLISPIGVLNIIRNFTDWTSDDDVWQTPEHWLQSEHQIYDLMVTGKDDCDGLSVAGISILSSFGYQNAQLCLCQYGENLIDKWQYNHLIGLFYDQTLPNDPFIMEFTADAILKKIPRLSECPDYDLFISANKTGDYYLWRDQCLND